MEYNIKIYIGAVDWRVLTGFVCVMIGAVGLR